MLPTMKCSTSSQPSRNRRNPKYTALAIVVLFLLTGCAIPLSPEGKMVRSISTTVAVQCRYIGLVHSFKPAFSGGFPAAQVDIRNKTAAAGGNAVVWVSQSRDSNGGADLTGEAYSCPF